MSSTCGLSISDYVAESKDERPERIKAGRRKPLSAFAIRELQAEEAARKRDQATA
jgi:hypothetical protein